MRRPLRLLDRPWVIALIIVMLLLAYVGGIVVIWEVNGLDDTSAGFMEGWNTAVEVTARTAPLQMAQVPPGMGYGGALDS